MCRGTLAAADRFDAFWHDGSRPEHALLTQCSMSDASIAFPASREVLEKTPLLPHSANDERRIAQHNIRALCTQRNRQWLSHTLAVVTRAINFCLPCVRQVSFDGWQTWKFVFFLLKIKKCWLRTAQLKKKLSRAIESGDFACGTATSAEESLGCDVKFDRRSAIKTRQCVMIALQLAE